MNIFDTHCDTPQQLFRKGLHLDNGITAVSLSKTEKYNRRCYVTAFWSDSEKNGEECFEEFLESSDYFDRELEENSGRALLCRCADDLEGCEGRFCAIKAVEGAKLLCGDTARLKVLSERQVKVLIPMWQGSDGLGGSWDTCDGLTDFGKKTVRLCGELGITVDTSHMSEQSFYDTLKCTDYPVIASHSNSRELCGIGRNISDRQFSCIMERHGIVGVCFYPKFTCDKYYSRGVREGEDYIGETAEHILHFLELGGERSICIGSDFDGMEPCLLLPDARFYGRLYERLIYCGVPESTVQDIFFNNAYSFFKMNI